MMTFHRRIATQINIMGMELHAEQSDYAEMENVEISDTMLFYHVRGALKSAVEVGWLNTYLKKNYVLV